MSPSACRWPRASGHPQLVGSHRHTGHTAHDFHENPDAPLWRDCLDRPHKIRKGPRGQPHLISGIQKLRRQELAGGVAAQHQLAHDIERHGCRLLAEAHQSRDAIGRVDCAPVPRARVERHENVSRKKRSWRGDELSPHPFRAILCRQEGPKPLQLEIALGNVTAVRLQLRQKPARTSIVKRHHKSPLISERMALPSSKRQILFRAAWSQK